jgi:hypothetical protein
MPFIDPNTREKLKFNENLREYVPPEQLYELFGGDCIFEYDHKTFWPAYLKLAKERRDKFITKFRALGGEIGLSELEIRAADEVVAEAVTPASQPQETVVAAKTEEKSADAVKEPATQPAEGESPAATANGVDDEIKPVE